MVNNRQQSKRTFNPNNSNKSIEIINMSDEELFNRYFIKDNGVAWLDDFNKLKIATNKNGDDVYPQILSFDIANNSMSTILSILHHRLLKMHTPNGYKFNVKNFMDDLETILKDNPDQTLEVTGTAKANEFIVQLSNFFVEALHNGVVYYRSSLSIN